MRSTVTAFPRTEGNAKGVTSAIRGGIAGKHTGPATRRPDGLQRIGSPDAGIL